MKTYQKKILELKSKEIIEKLDKVPTKILLSESNSKDKRIDSIKHNDKTYTDPEEIKSIFHKHYDNLLGNQFRSFSNMDDYLFDIPTVNDKNFVKRMNEEFTVSECYEIIKDMDSSSPGLNGLTLNFYKIF